MLEKLTESLPGMVYQCRLYPTGRCVITFANEAIEWIYEKRLADVQHDCSSILDLVHPEDRPHVEETLRDSMKNLTPWKGEYRVFLPSQGLRWRSAHARVERLIDGSTLWHGFVADITAKKTAEEMERVESMERALKEARETAVMTERRKLEQLASLNRDLAEQATHDGLTGVFSRRYFDDAFAEVFGRMRRKKQPLTLLFCDIDHFKEYNDNFGHQAGDACLMAVARAMSTQVAREGQFLARYGGEEFVAVLPGLGVDRAEAVAEKIRAAVESLDLKRNTRERTVTVSVGVATVFPITHKMRPGMLLREADVALYEAKHSGRNQVCFRIVAPEDDLTALRDDRTFSTAPELDSEKEEYSQS